jgi:hypothetical protein
MPLDTLRSEGGHGRYGPLRCVQGDIRLVDMIGANLVRHSSNGTIAAVLGDV